MTAQKPIRIKNILTPTDGELRDLLKKNLEQNSSELDRQNALNGALAHSEIKGHTKIFWIIIPILCAFSAGSYVYTYLASSNLESKLGDKIQKIDDKLWELKEKNASNEKLKISVEVDGKSHKLKKWKFLDKRKTEVLNSLGWKVLRFWNEEVMTNPQICLQKIQECMI